MSALREAVLLQRRLRGFATNTVDAYIHAMVELWKFFQRPLERLTCEEVQRFLDEVITVRKLAWATVNVYFSAYRFLYEQVLKWPAHEFSIPRRGRSGTRPGVLNRQEVDRLIEAPRSLKHRALLETPPGWRWVRAGSSLEGCPPLPTIHREQMVLFGGPHPTFFPELILEPGVDAVCRGEGELAFAEFCSKMETSGSPVAVPNFSVKTATGVTSLPPRPLVSDLDALPFPDRDLYYNVSGEIRKHRIRSFLASRGCVFRCTYCFNPAMDTLYDGNWRQVRTRSPRNLVDEIAGVIATYQTEFVAFRESIFPMEAAWLEEFAADYKSRVGLPFYCHLRLDLLNERAVELLAQAGCYSVNVGIETGNEELRRHLLCRTMTNESIVAGCDLLHRHGIKILANNMLGLPGATLQHDLETLELNQKCRPDYALAMLWQTLSRRRVDLLRGIQHRGEETV